MLRQFVMNDVTIDSVFEGRLRVKQARLGYRFSMDAVVLAYFVGPLSSEKVLDLGTGCGIIPLILAFRHEGVIVHGVEIQSELARIAAENINDNGMADRVRIHCIDMKEVTEAQTSGPVDLVIGNPPFHRVEAGRLNPNSQRSVARHEIKVTLAQLIETASRMLRDGGRFVSVFPVVRMVDMLQEMRRRGLEPKTLRVVHPKENGPAKLFLVEGIKAGRPGLDVPPPLVLYGASGEYTDEAASMFLP